MNRKFRRYFIAGHRGMVGRAICRKLSENPNNHIITADRKDLDLCDPVAVKKFVFENKPHAIVLAAARVGGILANNNFPVEFLNENLKIQLSIFEAAHYSDVQQLLFLGSSCIYPKFASQPITENELLKSYLEPTNEPYAIAKIAGVKMCESYMRQFGRDYRCLMPTNLYGPHDNFDETKSHVLPALLKRFHDAKQTNLETVKVWGTGKSRREFMHVEDLGDAVSFVLDIPQKQYEEALSDREIHVNVGTGKDLTIKELAHIIAKTVGYQGQIIFDTSKPDGTPRKQLEVGKMRKLGWSSKIDIEVGIKNTYQWMLDNLDNLRV